MARGRGLGERGFLSLAFLLALALRFLPFAAATDGGLRLLSPDCYGHLRRATAVARDFPRVPVRDAYLNHPDGGVWIWPPAFDLAVGGVSRLLFGPRAQQDDVAWVAATLPPLLGALHLFPFATLARRALSGRRARLAVAAYAVLPTAILWSAFGHADHHVAEVLALLLFLVAALRSAEPALSPRRRAARAALAGAALALALLTWQGAVFVAVVALPWAVVALGPFAALLYGSAAAWVGLGTWATLGGERVPFAFISFGWFQPAFLGAIALALALAAAFTAERRGARLLALGAASALGVLVGPVLPDVAAAFRRGGAHVLNRADEGTAASTHALPPDDFADGGYLSYPPDLLAVIAEARPLLDAPLLESFRRALGELSIGLLLLPAMVVLWSIPALRLSRHPSPLARLRSPAARRAVARLLVVSFGAALLAMTLAQRRNAYYLALFSALALAESVGRGEVALARRRRRPIPRLLGPALAALAAVALGFPLLGHVRRFAEAPGADFLALLASVGAADPPPAAPGSPGFEKPGSVEGVMTPWAAGHFVTALTRRPAAADPFGYGWRRQARFYAASDDREAEAILRAARCRYVLTADLRPVLPRYAVAAGRAGAPLDAMLAVRVHFSPSPTAVPFLRLAFASRSGSRLPGGRFVPAYAVWRVVDAAPSPVRAPP